MEKTFKINFPYWASFEVEVGTKFDLIDNKYYGESTFSSWEEYDTDYMDVESDLEMFEITEITKIYSDGTTDFYLEGNCVEIDEDEM